MRALTLLVLAAATPFACAPAPEPEAGGGGSSGAPSGPWIGGVSTAHRTSELTGGTLTLDRRGEVALVSDTDADQVVVVRLDSGLIMGRLSFKTGARPGRATLDGSGNFVVALRGLGEVVTVSSASGGLVERRSVCSEPVGLAWDAAARAVKVACTTGELVSLPESSSEKPVWTRPGPDLRDVVSTPGRLWVTSFRAARAIGLDANGAATITAEPPQSALGVATFVPDVAWKATSTPAGDLLMVHQRVVEGDIAAIQVPTSPSPPYYTNSCTSPIVRSALTVIGPDGAVKASFEIPGALPVDVAVSPNGLEAAVVLAGAHRVERVSLARGLQASSLCSFSPASPPLEFEPIAAAFTPDGRLVVQGHTPPQLTVYPPIGSAADPRVIPVGLDRPENPAYVLFHTQLGGLACASCHPEGREDGHSWTFAQGKVRTQTLAGGLSATAPYHWNGALAGMKEVLDETMVRRMGGNAPEADVVTLLEQWIDGSPAPGALEPVDNDAVTRGQAVFTTAGGCASCHTGKHFTNDRSVDVGTGGVFQVPSLSRLAGRGPWMHDGCATTLKARFAPACGGTAHGGTSNLTPAQVDDLVAYLESL